MKKIVLVISLFISLNNYAQEIEIKSTIQSFFEGFHAKDTIKIKSFCHEKMLLQTIAEGKNGTLLQEESPNDFIKSISSFPKELKFEERILGFNIQIDGNMAHVWTPYEFYINEKFSHKGVNSFTLIFANNCWKIVHLIDTRRRN